MELKLNPLKTSSIVGPISKLDETEIFMGKLDSANADIMIARLHVTDNEDKVNLKNITLNFSKLMSWLIGARVPYYTVTMEELDFFVKTVNELKSSYGFVNSLEPIGNNVVSAFLSKARATVREAELQYARVYLKEKLDIDHNTVASIEMIDSLIDTLESLNTWKTDEYDIIYEYINKVSLYLYYLAIKYERGV